MLRERIENKWDAVLHPGDVSYADGNEVQWDNYMRMVEPVAATVPYMTTPGNHELWWNFTAYKARFVMPVDQSESHDLMYYSFDLPAQRIHFIGFNTETWYDLADIDKGQLDWLKQDLSSALSRGARWIIAYAHRPVYCANGDDLQCGILTDTLQSALDSLFVDQHVDLVLTAHMHNMQRTWPTTLGVPVQFDYDSPTAPVYVVNGAAGNREGQSRHWKDPLPPWLAWKSEEYGYSHLTISPNALTFQFIADATGEVIDQFIITKQPESLS